MYAVVLQTMFHQGSLDRALLYINYSVNNAGVLGGDISNCTEQEYDTVLDTNLKGVFFLTKLVARHMIDNHIDGNILNIASSSRPVPTLKLLCRPTQDIQMPLGHDLLPPNTNLS